MSTHHSSPLGQPSHAVTTRSKRVAQRSAERGFFVCLSAFLKSDHRGKFIVLMFLTSIVLGCVVGAWNEPFRFRVNRVADRAIICNTPFTMFSPEQTQMEAYHVQVNAPRVFVNDPEAFVQLRKSLSNILIVFYGAESYDKLSAEDQQSWAKFVRPAGQTAVPEEIDLPTAFAEFIAAIKSKNEENFESFQSKLERIFLPYETHGILIRPPSEQDHGNQDRIFVYQKNDPTKKMVKYQINTILFRGGDTLKNVLRQEVADTQLSEQVFNWIYHNIYDDPKYILKEDESATTKVAQEAADGVKDIHVEYTPGQLLVGAGKVIRPNDLYLLFSEYKTALKGQTKTKRFCRFVSISGIYFLTLVIMVALVFRVKQCRPHTPHEFFYLMLGLIVTVAAAQLIQWFPFTSTDWEILPIVLFVMLVSIVYSWELATIFSIFLTTVLVYGNGSNIDLFILLLGSSVATAVQLGRLRSRRKIVLVSIVSGIVAFFLTITLGIQGDRPMNEMFYMDAFINFLWVILAGLLMTGLLPFIERQFNILTDMRLLELGDVSHPLMQELIKVAPATYGHCTQVGVIAETAADAINARGLLTRVGAYFHDIGKIMKPEFFSENQGGIENIHDTIEPQISTIVLIAHVKDGVDLARQFALPNPLIDLIEQHHGTSLVAFFYDRASKNGKEGVEESTFRYPGPKPQTKEAAILMIADTCESACRSMGMGVQPNKVEARIRALVKQKLDDGQFDDSGLTLNEIKIVEKSVTGSIVAAMHGRIQYPETDKQGKSSDSGISNLESIVRPEAYITGVHRADHMA